MKHALLILFLLSGTANAASLVSRMGPATEVGEERHYKGKATVDGMYLLDEEGRVEFQTKGREWLRFSNQDEAKRMLGLDKTAARIDMTTTCAVQGKARIQIVGLVAPKVAIHPWKATDLKRVVSKAAPQFVKCGKS